MITFDRGLAHRVDRYLLGRDVSAGYAEQLRKRLAAFCNFCGCDVREDAVTAELGNAWLAKLQTSGLSADTVDGYRRALLAVINDEEETTGTKLPFLRLRRIKKSPKIIRAYTHEELKLLVTAATLLTGTVPGDDRLRRDWWAGLIEAGYSTGLRRGDLFRFDMDSLNADGSATVVQHKTKVVHTVVFSPTAIGYMRRLGGRFPFACPYHLSYVREFWERLKTRAGVPRGSFRWVRRAAGSHAEACERGTGHLVLGQTSDKCFKTNYEDKSITKPKVVSPPPLE